MLHLRIKPSELVRMKTAVGRMDERVWSYRGAARDTPRSPRRGAGARRSWRARRFARVRSDAGRARRATRRRRRRSQRTRRVRAEGRQAFVFRNPLWRRPRARRVRSGLRSRTRRRARVSIAAPCRSSSPSVSGQMLCSVLFAVIESTSATVGGGFQRAASFSRSIARTGVPASGIASRGDARREGDEQQERVGGAPGADRMGCVGAQGAWRLGVRHANWRPAPTTQVCGSHCETAHPPWTRASWMSVT